MEKLIDRRKFLESSVAWTVASSGLTVPVETSIPTVDYKQDFIKAARRMGGCDSLGLRLSDPWLGPDKLWNTAYQNAVLQKDIYGDIVIRNILDDLTNMGVDDALGSNRFGIFVPLPRPLSDRDYLNIPVEISNEIDRLSSKGVSPGGITSPLTNYGAFGIVRYQKMALQRWNDGLVTKILIGNALGPLGIIPPESLLISAKRDDSVDCLEGQSWVGRASYYSNSGCMGCSSDRTMANGEKFDEDAMTLAFMRLPLNSSVLVENLGNGLVAKATVTDRGWFELWGRKADLSKGLRDRIKGGDITQVKITQLICS